MPRLNFTKTAVGLAPWDQGARQWFDKVEPGRAVAVNVVLPRNLGFHRKFFAMLNVAYENREWPEIETKWGKVRTNFEAFRKYVTVKSGHYTVELLPNGQVKAEPKSISWDKMEQGDFERLYSDALDVILAEFLDNWTTADMETAINEMLTFT